MSAHELAIVGMACRFPRADGVDSFWSNLRRGVDGIRDVPETHWRPEDYFDHDPATPDKTYGRRGGFLDPVDFAPLEWGMAPRDMEATDTTQLMGMIVAREALEDAGYRVMPQSPGEKVLDRERTSVILGVTGTLELVIPLGARLGHPIWRRALAQAGVDGDTAEDVVARISQAYVPWQENSFPGLLGNVVAGRIANRLDLHGTNCVVDAACASSLSAIHLAAMELESGRSDVVVTGGLDTFNDIFMYMCFSKTPALSKRGDVRPFDADGDGTILGEGVGIVVLKRLADAERDGDRIYAVLEGVGSSSDGKGDAVYAPSSAGQARALRRAYAQAGVEPQDIGLIEAHGTGTRVGDATEARGLTAVYAPDSDSDSDSTTAAPWCALGSVKSMIGHTKAAAGAAGLIKAALALHHRVLPPTLKVERPNEAVAPDTTPFYVNSQARPWLDSKKGKAPRAGVSAFGFGGSNFHAVLRGHVPRTKPAWDGRVQIIALSAGSRAELRDRVQAFADALTSAEQPGGWMMLRGLAAGSRACFDADANARVCLVVEPDDQSARETGVFESASSLLHTTADALDNPDDEGLARLQTLRVRGVYYGEGRAHGFGQTAILFAGQGAQYPGMLRDLACQFPLVRATIEEAVAGTELGDVIHPRAAFDDATARAQVEALRATEAAQPSLGAVELAAFRLLSQFGLRAGFYAGHSYGELVALAAAGWIDDPALHRLSRLRGRLMGQGSGDRGSMLAVVADIAAVEQFVADNRLQLVLANRNTPNQVVLSGPTPEIERAQAQLESRGFRVRRLSVAAAFHSPLVAGAQAPFAEALAEVEVRPTEAEVLSNSTARTYPREPETVRRMLAGQLARPVEFVSLVEHLYAKGVRSFIEIGPGRRVAGMVSSILAHALEGPGPAEDRPTIVSLDESSGGREGQHDLARLLGCLASRGHALDLCRWDEDASALYEREQARARDPKRRLRVPITGANSFQAPEPRPPLPRRAPSPPVVASPIISRPPASHTMLSDDSKPSSTPTGGPPAVSESILRELIKLQEQTADLHRQFLESQDQATRTLERLLTQGRDPRAMDTVAAPVPVARPTVEPARLPEPAPEPERTQVPAGADHVAALLEVVADKTGYPAEMLTLDMGLDADLGIDSIKRVEILGALQERLPSAPTIEPAQLGELQTLGQIADFLGSGTGSVRAESVSDSAPLPTAPVPVSGSGAVSVALMEVVAEKTGYPVEMLEPAMGLDADLGIDSIKRVEILGALQERLPDAPAIEPAQLGELQTLGQIIDFLEGQPGGSPANSSHPNPATHQAVLDVDAALLAVVAETTGYPVEMLEMGMGLDADLGIDSIKRVEIFSRLQERLPGAPTIEASALGELRTLAEVAAALSGATAKTVREPTPRPRPNPRGALLVLEPCLVPTESAAHANKLVLCGGPVFVSDADPELARRLVDQLTVDGHRARLIRADGTLTEIPSELAGLVLTDGGSDASLFGALRTARDCGPALLQGAESGGAVFATVSRLDGGFGLHGLEADWPVSGAGLSGLAKTAALEWPAVRVRAFDLEPADRTPSLEDAATQIVAELADDDSAREVGLSRRGAVTVGLESTSPPTTQGFTQGPTLGRDDVVLVTGGARGVTAELAVALASLGIKLALFGRSPEPTEEPQWLVALAHETEIKRALLERSSSRMSPRELDGVYRQIAANREIASTLARIRAAGSGSASVVYRSCDVRDSAALASALDDVRSELGPVTGLVHGAGVLADRFIVDKEDDDFRRVYGTKVAGLEACLHGLGDDPLKVIMGFSSTTARFGRKGQSDYAMANEVLERMLAREAKRRPGCRVHAMAWGPWRGGMVDAALERVFAAEGVGLVGLEEGARLAAQTLAHGGAGQVTLVVGPGTDLSRFAPTPAPTPARVDVVPDQVAVATSKESAPELPTVFERTLELPGHAFLRDHVIDARAVLPLAMTLEWLAHGALHDNPGLHFVGVEALSVLKGAALVDGQSVKVRVCAGQAERIDDQVGAYAVPVQLCSGGGNGHRVFHARGRLLLAGQFPTAPGSSMPHFETRTRLSDWSPKALYAERLFHGPLLQGIEEVLVCEETRVAVRATTTATPRQWMSRPPRARFIGNPLGLDCAFQALIVWSFLQRGVGSLPTNVGSLRVFAPLEGVESMLIDARIDAQDRHRARADIDFYNPAGMLVAQIHGYECVIDGSLNGAFRRNRLAARADQRI